MVTLIFIGAIAALLLFLLLMPLRVTLFYEEDLAVTLSLWGLSFSLYPGEEKVRLSDYSKKKLRKKRRKAKEKERQQAMASENKRKKSVKQSLNTLRLSLYLLKNSYKKIASALRIKVHRLHVKVATDDAAKTAVLYGVASSSVAYLLEFLRDFTKTKEKKDAVAVWANFCDSESSIDVKISFTASLYRLLCLGLWAVRLFFRFRKKEAKKSNQKNGEIENGKQSQ